MSWLVVVFFPGLLMICTVGLQRLERTVHGERPSAGQLVTRLEQAARAAGRKPQRTLNEFSGAEPRPGWIPFSWWTSRACQRARIRCFSLPDWPIVCSVGA